MYSTCHYRQATTPMRRISMHLTKLLMTLSLASPILADSLQPNQFDCESIDKDLMVKYSSGNLKMGNNLHMQTLSDTTIVHTVLGQQISAEDYNVADATFSYTIIVPRMTLFDSNAKIDFKTQFVHTIGGGLYTPFPHSGLRQSNYFTEVLCQASYDETSQNLSEDALGISSAFSNQMPPATHLNLEIIAKVMSTGCTKASDFEVKLLPESGSQILSIRRLNPDLCETSPHEIEVNLKASSYNPLLQVFYKGQEVLVETAY